MRLKPFISLLIYFLLVAIIYRDWFSLGLISHGDFWPYFESMYGLRSIVPIAWDPNGGAGIGSSSIPYLWIHMNLSIGVTILGKMFGMTWPIVERISFLFPYLMISFLAPFLLSRKLFSDLIQAILAGGIYSMNTYILMIVGGGQVHGVGMAYSLFPLALFFAVGKSRFVQTIALGLILAFVLLFDLRFFYLLIIVLPAFVCGLDGISKKSLLYKVLLPFCIAIAIHAYWIIPQIFFPINPFEKLGNAYSSIEAVKFFSFADLANTMSLLHPNWFDNVFGKTSFMRPEFLILPILAFSSLFFLPKNESQKIKILFFIFLGLVGAFLAKGANDPFGAIYIYLFKNLPGFQMFRDPTKFYVLVALSFSMLIPFVITRFFSYLGKKFNKQPINNLWLLFTCGYLCFLIFPAISRHVNGTFKRVSIPQEYVKLENFIAKDKFFYRVLWIPTNQRFGYYSNLHPAVQALDYFNVGYDELLEKIGTEKIQARLREMTIRYIIVPYDSEKEIFIQDGSFNSSLQVSTIKSLRSIRGLKEIEGFNNIKIFELSRWKSHFWVLNSNSVVSVKEQNPVKYDIYLNNAKPKDLLVFAEGFDPNWQARISINNKKNSSFLVGSRVYDKLYNSFRIPVGGDIKVEVFYLPQLYAEIGFIFSILIVSVLIVILLYSKFWRWK